VLGSTTLSPFWEPVRRWGLIQGASLIAAAQQGLAEGERALLCHASFVGGSNSAPVTPVGDTAEFNSPCLCEVGRISWPTISPPSNQREPGETRSQQHGGRRLRRQDAANLATGEIGRMDVQVRVADIQARGERRFSPGRSRSRTQDSSSKPGLGLSVGEVGPAGHCEVGC